MFYNLKFPCLSSYLALPLIHLLPTLQFGTDILLFLHPHKEVP